MIEPPRKLFSIQVGDQEVSVMRLLRIDPDNLQLEYENHASWQATIAYLHAKAKLNTARLERQVKELEARKYLFFKEKFESVFGYKGTLETIKAATTSDEEV